MPPSGMSSGVAFASPSPGWVAITINALLCRPKGALAPCFAPRCNRFRGFDKPIAHLRLLTQDSPVTRAAGPCLLPIGL
jgi:hypothetical protein